MSVCTVCTPHVAMVANKEKHNYNQIVRFSQEAEYRIITIRPAVVLME